MSTNNPQNENQKLQAEQQSKTAADTDPATLQQGNLNPQNVDQKLQDDQKQKTAADFDRTAREAEAETGTREPGQSNGNHSNQHNNGRGGGK